MDGGGGREIGACKLVHQQEVQPEAQRLVRQSEACRPEERRWRR